MDLKSIQFKKNIRRLHVFLTRKKRNRFPWILVSGNSTEAFKNGLLEHHPQACKILFSAPISLVSTPNHTWVLIENKHINPEIIKIFKDKIQEVIYTATQLNEKRSQFFQLQNLIHALKHLQSSPSIRVVFTDAANLRGLSDLSRSLTTHELPNGFGLNSHPSTSIDYSAIVQSYDQFIQRMQHRAERTHFHSQHTAKELSEDLIDIRQLFDCSLSTIEKSKIIGIHWIQLPKPKKNLYPHLSLQPLLNQISTPQLQTKRVRFKNPWLKAITALLIFNGFLSIQLLSKNSSSEQASPAYQIDASQSLHEWLPTTIEYIKALKPHIHWYDSKQKKQAIRELGDTQWVEFVNQNVLPQIVNLAMDDINNPKNNSLDRWNAFLFIDYFLDKSSNNAALISPWINQYFSTAHPSDRKKLKNMLVDFHQHMKKPYSIDQNQRQLIRSSIKQINFTQASFLRISHYWNKQLIFNNKEHQIYHLNQMTIPAGLTSSHFNQVLSKDIPTELSLMEKQINSIQSFNLNPPSPENMQASLQNFYLHIYDDFWREQVNHISIQSPDLGAALNDLSDNNGQWKNIESTFIQNACGIPKAQSIKPTICKEWSSFSTKNYPEFENGLNQYSQKYQKTIQQTDAAKAAFNTTSTIMSDEDASRQLNQLYDATHQLPQPYQSMIQRSLSQSWQQLLSQSLLHINSIWKTNVFREYQQTISQAFPVKPNPLDLSIDQFDHFFSPNGTLSSFFSFYIQPYVMIEHNRWTLKALMGKSLPINTSALNAWNAAANIQNIFYPNNQSSASLALQIIPIQFSKETGSLSLQFFKQPFTISTAHMPSLDVAWSKKTSGDISVSLAKNKQVIYPGVWSWLRWLDSAQPQTGHLIHLSLNVGDQHVLFLMNLPVSIQDLRSLTSFNIPQTLTHGEPSHAITTSKTNAT